MIYLGELGSVGRQPQYRLRVPQSYYKLLGLNKICHELAKIADAMDLSDFASETLRAHTEKACKNALLSCF